MTTGTPAPIATYRVQLNGSFGFDDAASLVPYLAAMGVSHLYCSPYLQATPGSSHGYDVVDHSLVNAELGGPRAHRRLVAALRRYGLGQMVDVVPNHMAVGNAANRWWWDVLEHGPASRFGDHFDIDWHSPEAALHDQVLVPVLGDHYGRVLERGELWLERHGGTFVFGYAEHRFPVAPRSVGAILAVAAERESSPLLAYLADAFGEVPTATVRDRVRAERRHRDTEVLTAMLGRLFDESSGCAAAADQAVASLNADRDALHGLLERQNYRLANWRTASEELDYRRFFDVTMLAGLRVELPHVFDAVHHLVLEWCRTGDVDGLRIDHPDGLRDPAGYLHRLAWAAPGARIVVEKILAVDEVLPATWPVAGTTGYEFLNLVGGLFVDAAGHAAMTATYVSFTGDDGDFARVVLASKRDVVRRVLAADVMRLTARFRRICERQLRYRDFTRADLRRGIEAMLVGFTVYRTYVSLGPDGERSVSEDDERRIRQAAAAALVADDGVDPEVVAFLAEILLLRVPGADATDLALRFQQLTGPTMAKGVEDTACYRYGRLLSLNEVGGDPGRFGRTVAEFHRDNLEAARHRPERMLASSTHDTKRSEDVRTRISLLSECPDRWASAVQRWSRHNERYRSNGVVDRSIEYQLYQTLVGAHPLPADRAWAYVGKAVREAKLHTSWLEPDAAYESAVHAFVLAVLGDAEFVADVDAFVRSLLPAARASSLSQLVLKLTSPGVPDIYQGCEVWTDSLVDPDNRRVVDYEPLRLMLTAAGGELDDVGPLDGDDIGVTKLFVLRRVLALRARRQPCFAGAYRPLEASGPAREHLVAFGRGDDVVVAAPRLAVALADRGWRDSTLALPDGRWVDVFTGAAAHGHVDLRRATSRLPVVVWERSDT